MLLGLTVIAAGTGAVGRLGVSRGVAFAAARAAGQLALVSLVIVTVVRSLVWSAVFVGVMLAIATWTSARRMTRHRSGLLAVAPIVSGAAVVLATVLASGVVPLTGIAMVPVSGIVIGGAMTATSLAGRRALDELAARRGEYEAALSLGLLDRDAALLVARPSAAQALTQPLDQTRTLGLVTLPARSSASSSAAATPSRPVPPSCSS